MSACNSKLQQLALLGPDFDLNPVILHSSLADGIGSDALLLVSRWSIQSALALWTPGPSGVANKYCDSL